ncbi:IS1096 element passenger TnpR family protein [Capnocytophaga cynodegmi]|uniref:IS1096 element passenger TnpR family protein n=1 Tax=Capnocytophaga cynodegmi TaxID=28189 RepID=UPI00385983DC
MIYKFRVILDVKEDVFRDIVIQGEASLEDFHNVIVQSFGFAGDEMASFYLTDDDWNQGEEITLFDLSESGEIRLMEETSIDSVVSEEEPKLLYVYDFFSMWTFFVELVEIAEEENGVTYPSLLFAHGSIPAEAPERNFESDDFNEFEDEFSDFDMDEEDYDNFREEDYY